jgi:hypothetical protein
MLKAFRRRGGCARKPSSIGIATSQFPDLAMGQEEHDNCAATTRFLAASQSDSPLMSLHDVGTDPQAKTSAANSLGRKECFEKLCFRVRAYPASIVRNGEEETKTARTPFSALTASYHQSATTRHRIDSIPHQVGQHLAYIPFEAFNRLFRIASCFNLNVRVSESPFKNKKHGFEQAFGAE